MNVRKRSARCSRCSAEPRPGQSYCHKCHAANMREWRKTHPLVGAARDRMIARAYANVYQRRGKIVAEPCETCGDPKVEKHHDDYTKPLAIRWMCRRHHRAHHRSLAGIV